MKANHRNREQHYPFEKSGRRLIDEIKRTNVIDELEIQRSWAKVEQQSVSKRGSGQVRRLWLVRVAVSIAVLVSLIWLRPFDGQNNEDLFTSDFFNNDLLYNSITHLTLVTPDRVHVLNDVTTILYDDAGTVCINNQDIVQQTQTYQSTTKDECVRMNHLIVPKGKRVSVIFSDGSIMTVNSGTKVIYPVVFESHKREIAVEGEVFLDVAKDSNRPFFVKGREFEIKVLGTQFNISAYKENTSVEVILVNGRVEVKSATENKTVLMPNQMVRITKQETQVLEVDVTEYICWKEGVLLLKDKNVGEILRKLERYYDRKIICSKSLSNLVMTGKLDLRENVVDVVDTICETLFLSWDVTENETIEIY